MAFRIYVTGKRAFFHRSNDQTAESSYDVLTPLAARGILASLYWKPAIRWLVDRIHVLKPIRYTGYREHGSPWAPDAIGNAAEFGHRPNVLLDVSYIIEARLEMTDRAGPRDTYAAHTQMFLRKARRGDFFRPPYLGSRQYPAEFALLELSQKLPKCTLPLSPAIDLGLLPYEWDHSRGKVTRFVRCALIDGVIDVSHKQPRVESPPCSDVC